MDTLHWILIGLLLFSIAVIVRLAWLLREDSDEMSKRRGELWAREIQLEHRERLIEFAERQLFKNDEDATNERDAIESIRSTMLKDRNPTHGA